MKNFLRQLLTATLAYVLGSLLILVILFMIISGKISSATENKKVEVENKSVLLLRLRGSMDERATTENMPAFFPGADESTLDLSKCIGALKAAEKDERIKGLFIDVDGFSAGSAHITALRKAIADFKASGKFVLSYGDVYSEKTYYLASAGDSVFANPYGYIEWNGMVSEQGFARNFLDRWGFEPILFRVGKYKSAAENIIQDKLSDANREQLKALVDDLWADMVQTVAKARGISPDSLQVYAEKLLVNETPDAVKYKLVDAALYRDEVLAIIRKKLEVKDDAKIPYVSLHDYFDSQKANLQEDKVTVIYAVGNIIYGQGDNETIGNRGLVEELRRAREDEKCKAVVLRINSGGGSALASDIIWREVELTRKKKPVIASFGNVAASGGYYIAAACDQILAEPTTITGSIGVFGLIFNSQKFFNKEIGFTFDRVYSANTNSADLGNPNRPMTAAERQTIQSSVDNIYQVFLTRVLEGRKAHFKSLEEVDAVAQGRVYTGNQALALKLVDGLGGLDRAVEIAAEKAGLGTTYRREIRPKQESPFEKFFKKEQEKRELAAISGYLPTEIWEMARFLRSFNDPRHVYTRLPMELQVN
jgi:protease-4